MVDISEVAENIYMIDEQLFSVPNWGSVYLINEGKKALIDTGPTTSVNTVVDGIKRVGVRPEDIDYLIVTHIHLDHAGGAGVLIKDMPRAQVLVHHKGARHLVNPAKLVSGMLKAHGDGAVARHGEVVPIGTDRVRPVYGGEVIRLSERQVLEFIDAPGHAPHELCIYESRNNGLFTGDAVGICIAEEGILLPASPPPDFDLELYIDTLQRLMKLKAARIYFAHFGVSNKVQETLQLVIDKLQAWDDIVTTAIKENGFNGVEEMITAQWVAELEPLREKESLYRLLAELSIPLNVAGYVKYYIEKYEAELNGGRHSESNPGKNGK